MKAFLSIFFILTCFLSQGQYKAPEVDSLLAFIKMDDAELEFFQELVSDEFYATLNVEQRMVWNELFVSLWKELKETCGKATPDTPSENTLELYPNPTSDQLHLKGDWQNIRQITAIDEQGKQMDLSTNELREGVLSLEELQAGRYILTFYFETSTMMKRVVKR